MRKWIERMTDLCTAAMSFLTIGGIFASFIALVTGIVGSLAEPVVKFVWNGVG